MRLYVKIGTLSAQWVEVVRRRKPPEVGDTFLVRERPEAPRMHSSVLLREIRRVGDDLLYVVERW